MRLLRGLWTCYSCCATLAFTILLIVPVVVYFAVTAGRVPVLDRFLPQPEPTQVARAVDPSLPDRLQARFNSAVEGHKSFTFELSEDELNSLLTLMVQSSQSQGPQPVTPEGQSQKTPTPKPQSTRTTGSPTPSSPIQTPMGDGSQGGGLPLQNILVRIKPGVIEVSGEPSFAPGVRLSADISVSTQQGAPQLHVERASLGLLPLPADLAGSLTSQLNDSVAGAMKEGNMTIDKIELLQGRMVISGTNLQS